MADGPLIPLSLDLERSGAAYLLVSELRKAWGRAGWPSSHQIKRGIDRKYRKGDPSRVSHASICDLLSGRKVQRWEKVRSVALLLECDETKIEALWRRARQERQCSSDTAESTSPTARLAAQENKSGVEELDREAFAPTPTSRDISDGSSAESRADSLNSYYLPTLSEVVESAKQIQGRSDHAARTVAMLLRAEPGQTNVGLGISIEYTNGEPARIRNIAEISTRLESALNRHNNDTLGFVVSGRSPIMGDVPSGGFIDHYALRQCINRDGIVSDGACELCYRPICWRCATYVRMPRKIEFRSRAGSHGGIIRVCELCQSEVLSPIVGSVRDVARMLKADRRQIRLWLQTYPGVSHRFYIKEGMGRMQMGVVTQKEVERMKEIDLTGTCQGLEGGPPLRRFGRFCTTWPPEAEAQAAGATASDHGEARLSATRPSATETREGSFLGKSHWRRYDGGPEVVSPVSHKTVRQLDRESLARVRRQQQQIDDGTKRSGSTNESE